MKVFAFALLLALLSSLAPSSSSIAAADTGSDYIYCILTDSIHSTEYFSGVFQGDFSLNVRSENAFWNYVHGNYSGVIGGALCFFRKSAPEARDEENAYKARGRGIYNNLIDTGWSY